MTHVFKYDLTNRDFFVRRATIWVRVQAKRLGYTADDILDAVCSGWLAEDIEVLSIAEAGKLRMSPAKAKPLSVPWEPLGEPSSARDNVRPWRPREGSMSAPLVRYRSDQVA